MNLLSPVTSAARYEHFDRAYRRAKRQRLNARLTGSSADLLCFRREQRRLGSLVQRAPELADVPLHLITGSVGRCSDFTRSFAPRLENDRGRWVDILTATLQDGLPPVELYELGGRYFVLDGHHRVSVARQLGHAFIEAYVTPFQPVCGDGTGQPPETSSP